jgi:ATP-dependent exoDNAse (exonuclease V) beta subunit
MSVDVTQVAEVADAAERERALDPQRSFIVQAPAGSGKTELLVRRFVRLLATVQRPEEVLAITFTRKAAAEMKKRVLAALDAATVADIAPRLRIMTIDSLCTSLTRQMPVLARFGAQPAIVEADEAQRLYAEAAARTLAHLEKGGTASRQVAALLLHLDNNAMEAQRLLAGMLARRDQWLRRAGDPPTREELEGAFSDERERLLARAQVLHPAASPELAQQVLTKAGEWRKRPPAPTDMVGNEPLRMALCALLELPPAAYREEQWQVLEAILSLLKLAAAELKLVFGERGQADFTEYAQAAVAALGSSDDPSELLLRVDASLRHILVDEFQDTSVSQWALLEHLTAGWESGGPDGSPGDGRTVFAVGDPMQSIYRFREAEVALFLRARRDGLRNVRLEPLTLRTNFRSQAGIVDWVNATFARVLPQQEDEAAGAVPYSPAVAHPGRPRREGVAATFHLFGDPATARQEEAARVVELARAARQSGGSCAILVRNRNALIDIAPALDRAGIAYRAVEIERLGEKQVVQDLFALVRSLSHPADRIAWLALLRARWCGLTLADLHGLAGIDAHPAGDGDPRNATVWELLHDEIRLAGLSEDGRARALRLRDVLAPAMERTLRGSLRQRAEGAWLALGGPACVDERTELEDAAIFFDRLDEPEDAGDIEDAEALAESLGDLYALPDVAAGEHDLQIMTMHKAKGLEFDTVILPGLDRSPRSGERPLMAWKPQSDGGLLLAPINAHGDTREPLYKHVRLAQREAEDIEGGRLLYVAATRARERLHLLGCTRCNEDGSEKEPPRRSLLAQLWPVIGDQVRQARPSASPVAGEAQAASPTSAPGAPQRLVSGWRMPAAPPALDTAPAAPAARTGEVIIFSWAGETARHIGSVAHRWLQRIAEDALQGWDARRVAALRGAFRAQLAALGVGDAELERAAGRVSQSLELALKDERGRWLLGPQREARNEYRLSVVTGELAGAAGRAHAGVLRHFIIDRTFIDAQGRRWIVDYKTSPHQGGDVEAFLDSERERYRRQLEGYAAAFPGLPAGTLSFGLYFPLLGGWREWSLS